ncbi:MAG: divalent metal cation transporter [Patescibacteria group bacterium]|nr:divalent metal cation transporter [Patescibacteria group bacterium]
MIEKIASFWTELRFRFLSFFLLIGSGLLGLIGTSDVGAIATLTVGVAKFGMSSQLLIILIGLIWAAVQEMSLRVALVTKKGLGDLIRERYGVSVSLFVFCLFFLSNQGVVIQNLAGLKASFQIFQLPWQPATVLLSLFLFIFIVKSSFRKVQKFFLFGLIISFSYVISAFLARPNWLESARKSFLGPENGHLFSVDYWFVTLAILGTIITPWSLFFSHSVIAKKKLNPHYFSLERKRVYLSSFFTILVIWLMAAGINQTLFQRGINNPDLSFAHYPLIPVFGQWAQIFLSLGFLGISIFGLLIVPFSSALVFSEMFGYGQTEENNLGKSWHFFFFFILQLTIAWFFLFFSQKSLFEITLVVDYLNATALPVIGYFLTKFCEDKSLLEASQNSILNWRNLLIKVSLGLVGFGILAVFLDKLIKI